MRRDKESFKMSPSFGDFATYGRFLSAANSNIGVGAFGDPCLHLSDDWSSLLRRIIPGGPFSALFASGRMMVPNGDFVTVGAYDAVNSANQVQVTFYGGSGVISVSRGSTVLLTTAPGQFPLSAYFWCSILFAVGAGAAGAVGVNIGSVNKVNLSGVNTQNTGRGYFDTVSYIGTGYLQHLLFDDTTGSYNNTYAPDQRVLGEFPNGAGASTQFTPYGNAANYLNAAASPPAPATDNNTGATVGLVDLYTVPGPSGVTSVSSVMISAIAAKTDSGARSLATVLRSGGVTASGVSVPLASSDTVQADVWEVDPSTSVPFIPSALAALQVGAEVSA